MPYDPTLTDLDALDPTMPSGSEAANLIDEILRETRSALKAVMLKAHTSTGEMQVVVMYERVTADLAVVAANVWERRKLDVQATNGVSGISGSNNTWQLPAGTYLLYGGAMGFQCGKFKLRMVVGSGSVEGGVAQSSGTVAVASWAHVFAIQALTGTQAISLETMAADAGGKWALAGTSAMGTTSNGSAFLVALKIA